MWNLISKLIDPNFKPAPSGLRGNSKGKKRGKAPYNKKRKFIDEKRSSFGDKPKSFGRGRSDRPSRDRDGEKKSFGFKGKKSFFKKDKAKPTGFTNNPKYFGKKPLENTSNEGEKKSFSFKGKKKFKGRSNRPKSFTFKKHSQKRAKI
jgi:hypothetical protein